MQLWISVPAESCWLRWVIWPLKKLLSCLRRSCVPVLRQEPAQLTDAYLVLRELELSESAVVPCGDTLGDLAEASSAVAIDLKRKTNFS